MPKPAVITAPSVPHRALVVDDEAAICAMLAAQLASAGWDAVMATTCAEARRVIADKSATLDMVFIDVRLPDGDGMDLIPAIQARRDHPDVVVITGYRDEETLVRAVRHGVLDLLFKPLTMSDIAVALRRRAIRERRSLGLTLDRFERVDREFAAVHRELDAIRRILSAWGAPPPQAAQARGA